MYRPVVLNLFGLVHPQTPTNLVPHPITFWFVKCPTLVTSIFHSIKFSAISLICLGNMLLPVPQSTPNNKQTNKQNINKS